MAWTRQRAHTTDRLRAALLAAMGLAAVAPTACGASDSDASDAAVAAGSGGTSTGSGGAGTGGHAASAGSGNQAGTGGAGNATGGTGGTAGSFDGGAGVDASAGTGAAAGTGGSGATQGAAGGPCSGIDPDQVFGGGAGANNVAKVSCFTWQEMATWPDGGSCYPEPVDAGPGPYPEECRPELDVPLWCMTYCTKTIVGSAEKRTDGCCYCQVVNESCLGRPFGDLSQPAVAEGGAADDWCEVLVTAPLAPEARERIGAFWRRSALLEHASIAAFAQLALQLLAHGAPSVLIAECQRAGLDEIEHARACFALAAAFDGRAAGPGKLDTSRAKVDVPLAMLARDAALEGCIEETVAACIAREQLARATDPAVRDALARIADDEERHAALSWRIVQWALETGGPEVRGAVEAAFAAAHDATAGPGRRDPALEACGYVDAVAVRAIRTDAIRGVVRPCSRALLA